jgi:beta-glucanase (GH16 family)
MSACGTPAAAQIPDLPGWQLFWHDEFDASTLDANALDTTKWTALNRQDQNNNEKQYYSPGQVSVANGNLQITATHVAQGNKQYSSGLITSKVLFGQGRIEARIDLPTTQGMWPAFWMNPNQVQWPLGGEIDIMENKGSQPTITSSAFHWQKNPGSCCGQHQFVTNTYSATENGQPVNFSAGFHTYAAEWDKKPNTNVNEIRFYVDDHLYQTVDQTSAMSDANFTTAKNIIVNLAVGGDFGDPDATTIFPQTMLVDYVRVWHRPTGLAGDYNGDGKVDTADYVAWRQSVGQSNIGLPADGSGNGTVDQADYNTWRNNFGNTSAGAGAAASLMAAVPEPTAGVPMAISIMLLFSQRQRTAANP